MLSPSSSWLTPELWGEEVSQDSSLLAGHALLALLSWLCWCSQAPLASRTQRRFVKHGPEVLMSHRGTQQLPWLHLEIRPCPAPGLLHKHSPSVGRPTLGAPQ